MFCISIPLGLARANKGVAAFAGFVGYAVMNLAVNFWLTNKGILPTTDAAVLKANNIQSILRWLRRLCGNEPRGKLLVDQ